MTDESLPPLKTTDDLFDALSGPASVGRAIGITTEHAASYKRRGRVPPRHWNKLLEALREQGFTVTEADLLSIYNAADHRPNHPSSIEPAA